MGQHTNRNGSTRPPISMEWSAAHEQVRVENFFEIGDSEVMRKAFWLMTRVREKSNVLLIGETGTGKTNAAKVIHSLVYGSQQAPFVRVNLNALPEQLIGSELFGHEKGSFTGAERRRIGRMEEATGGAIFIDEVGVVPGLNQVQLLTALDDPRTFERIGGNETLSPEILVICATTSDLAAMVLNGEFNASLYERLRERVIRMPSLAERGPQYVADTVRTLLRKIASIRSQEEKKKVPELKIDDKLLQEFMARQYPGNLRELHFLVRDTANEAYEQGNPRIDFEHFDIALATHDSSPNLPGAAGLQIHVGTTSTKLADRTDDAFDRLLVELLSEHGPNQVALAKLMGISRETLRDKVFARAQRSGESFDGTERGASAYLKALHGRLTKTG